MGLPAKTGSEIAKDNLQNEPGQIFYLDLDYNGAKSNASRFSKYDSRTVSHFRHESNLKGLSEKSGSEIANNNIQDEPKKVFYLQLDESGTTSSHFSQRKEVQWIPAHQPFGAAKHKVPMEIRTLTPTLI